MGYQRVKPLNEVTFFSWQSLLKDISLLILSAVLFAFSHPNPVFIQGFGPTGFLALVPALYVLKNTSFPRTLFYGAFFGWLCYALLNYWLAVFNPTAWIIVPVIYLGYHLVFFPLLSLALRYPQPWAFWISSIVWVAYEFLRNQGYLAYSYGIMGYSQYLFTPWIQSADLGGVWLVTWLTVLPSFLIAQLLGLPVAQWPRRNMAALGVLMVANLVYGFTAQLPTQDLPVWKPALIQHDMDPWQGGIVQYRKGLERLIKLSEEALEFNPDAVIWSETAFVPSIEYHRKYRENAETYRLVEELMKFLEGSPVPFILGNGHGERVLLPGGDFERQDSNAALVFEKGRLTGLYRKIHLVPFTEHFPFYSIFPGVYDFLQANDVHFWQAGTERTVFHLDGLKVSTPICFEDSFGYLNREFVREGAQVLINLTNDSWSESASSMRQHLSMALFRTVENRRSMVRSSNGGWTAAIDPNGVITAEAPILEPFWIKVEVPIVDSEVITLYSAWGDWFGMLTLGVSVLFFGYTFGLRLTKGQGWFKIKRKDEKP